MERLAQTTYVVANMAIVAQLMTTAHPPRTAKVTVKVVAAAAEVVERVHLMCVQHIIIIILSNMGGTQMLLVHIALLGMLASPMHGVVSMDGQLSVVRLDLVARPLVASA